MSTPFIARLTKDGVHDYIQVLLYRLLHVADVTFT